MKDLTAYYKEVEESHGKEVAEEVRRLNTLFDENIYKWLASLWDGEMGGFYYSRSARDNEGFWPDMESTAQALTCLTSLGIITEKTPVPLPMQKKMIAFMQAKQDPEDGYFYHAQWGKDVSTSRRARDLGHAVGTIQRFGAKPLYPTATERIEAAMANGAQEDENSTVPEHLRSKEAFLEYLNSLNINGIDKPGNSYSVGHRIGQQAAEIRAAGLTDVCIDFLNSTQKSNGFWEDELNHGTSNGTMKISCTYVALERPFPRIMKAFESALDVLLNNEDLSCITAVFNPPFSLLNFIEIMEKTGDTENLAKAKALLRENAAKLLRITYDRLLPFKKPDGSFSYCKNCSSFWSQGKPVCIENSYESDVNANSLANGSKRRTLLILDIPTPPIFDEEDSKRFFELCGETPEK